MRELMSSRRMRLIALLLVASAAISVLAFRAASSSVSYYITPAEFRAHAAMQNARVRVAGRVVEGSIVEQAGRPVAFKIMGDENDEISVSFPKGVVPNLFGPYALVIVEGSGHGPAQVNADAVLIKHENQFYANTPPDGSISSHFVPTATATAAPGR